MEPLDKKLLLVVDNIADIFVNSIILLYVLPYFLFNGCNCNYLNANKSQNKPGLYFSKQQISPLILAIHNRGRVKNSCCKF